MSAKLGKDAKLYRNTGTYASPTWTLVSNVKDLTLNVEKGEADATTRANNGWRASLPTLKNGSVDFQMVWDPSDAGFTAIQTAFFADSTIEFAVMDGDITVTGTQGLRATMGVFNFSRNEALEEAITADVALKPAYNAANPPAWMTVP